MTQGNKIYQALDRNTVLVSRINSLLVLGPYMGFVDNKKIIMYQTHPFRGEKMTKENNF